MRVDMDIKIPEVGESVYEALVGRWLKQDGDTVAKDEALCEIETDKITFELQAEGTGTLQITVPAGSTVKIGTVIGQILEQGKSSLSKVMKPSSVPPLPTASAAPASSPPPVAAALPKTPVTTAPLASQSSPLQRKLARQHGTTPEQLPATPSTALPPKGMQPIKSDDGRTSRQPMTPIRKRIAERLLVARQQTAMLTTFNEAEMTRVQELRRKYQEQFQQRHAIKLGFMSFFVKACCKALQEFPAVNGRIEGSDIVYHHYCDIGIAIAGDKGLVVPVLRGAEHLSFAEIEQEIADYVDRVKANRLTIADLEGGTFTITNGGIFGSLMSTPILNPPQSGVMGMHAIQERPVVRDGQIVIRPMMYLALSYDHRIIDGREAVLFLKRVKELIEEPDEMLLEG
jgi:2-oxoglutarate dehydrogenase E2 component (dihydrolipoamide succinyltransferase)